MRNYLGSYLYKKISENRKTMLLVGDIGYGIFDNIFNDYPENIINCGISEQNMIGTAAGLAESGFDVYVYTIIPFLLARPYEFIKNLIGHQNLKVTLVGVGGGLSYDTLGFTHFAREDLILACTIPNLSISIPYDVPSLDLILINNENNTKSSYIRLMKGGEKDIDIAVRRNGFDTVVDFGNSFTIITYGGTVELAKQWAEKQHKVNFNGKVVAISTLEDLEGIEKIIVGKLFILEEQISPGVIAQSIFSYISRGVPYKAIFLNKNRDYFFNSRETQMELDGLSLVGLDQFL